MPNKKIKTIFQACVTCLLLTNATSSAASEEPLRVEIRELRLSGNAALTSAELRAALGLQLPVEMNFEDLQELANRLTAIYRANGFPLARAVLPRQDLTDGAVQMTIVEGRIGGVKLRNESHLDDAWLLALLEQNLCDGFAPQCVDQVIRDSAVERAIGLLTDLPGVTASTAYATGERPGTVDIIATVKSAKRVGLNGTLDNYGGASTGVHRLGIGGFAHGSLLRHDLIQGNVLATREKLYQYTIDYSLPVGPYGTRAGVSASRSSYLLGGSFASLGITGQGDGLTGFVTHPLLRSVESNSELRIDAGYRKLSQDGPTIQLQPDKSIVSTTARISGNRRGAAFGAPAYTTASAAVTVGHLNLRDAFSIISDASPLGANTGGRYAKLQISGSRLQSLEPGLSLFISGLGQLAWNNLDAAEKLSIGGADGVRAYPGGEGSGDDAAVASAEIRLELPPGESWRATAALFYDYGWTRASHRPLNNGTSFPLKHYAGIGLGVTVNWSRGISSKLFWARAVDSPASAIDNSRHRFGFQLQSTY